MSTDTFRFVRGFRYRILTHLLLIVATIIGTYVAYIRLDNTMWLVIGGIVLFFQVRSLLLRIERITRDLTSFLEAIQYSDFTQTFRSPFPDQKFNALYSAFSNVMQSFQKTRSDSEAQRRYLETLVHHVGIGLLCFHPDGTVKLINNSAKRLLDRPALINVNDLHAWSSSLTSSLLNISPGDHSLIQVDSGSEQLQISIYGTRFTLQNDEYILVSLQNIGTQLEDSEMDAMQHMTRVLSHEIMNSMTPIVSLAALAQEHLSEQNGETVIESPETIQDLQDALQTIEKRSEGLLHFVNAYRSITRIPQPELKLVQVSDLFARVSMLFDPRVQHLEIIVNRQIDPQNLSVLADPDLIEQVLINLIKNAIEAIGEQDEKTIILDGHLDRQGRVVIQVTDTGPGIPDEVLVNIFVPFFSTKPSGSGIGLSFSRHIMRRHQGHLRVQSQPGGPTTFTLVF